MIISAAFQGKQLSMEEAPCEVRKVISLPDKEYAFFKKHLIDMLSFITMHKQSWKSYSFAAACGVSDSVLWQTMKDCPYIRKVNICFDNDEPGQKAARRISMALGDKNICNKILVPTRKDWNEDLLFLRKEEAK